jgi:hypothetical protein
MYAMPASIPFVTHIGNGKAKRIEFEDLKKETTNWSKNATDLLQVNKPGFFLGGGGKSFCKGYKCKDRTLFVIYV